MKVLRTALLSAFLMICFMNVGHSQNLSISVDGAYITLTQHVSIRYNVNAPTNSAHTIIVREELTGAVLFTTNFRPSIMPLIFIPGDALSALDAPLECEVCDENFNCVKVGCIVATSVQTP